MRSETEIRKKISELMDKLEYVRRIDVGGGASAEAIMCNIDALLWVIGDCSGKAI